jgi:hypothetical protein
MMKRMLTTAGVVTAVLGTCLAIVVSANVPPAPAMRAVAAPIHAAGLQEGSAGRLHARKLIVHDNAQSRGGSVQNPAAPTIATDKFDYQPGETALITGAGFFPGEIVTLHVEHMNGLEDGSGHLPFYTFADGNGLISDQWYVNPDDSLHSIFVLSAEGGASGLKAQTIFTDALVEIVDDGGPDDYPGQKDLSFFSVDYGAPGATSIAVGWGWDDTAWSGNNTGDACALLDTDADGFANYSICVTVAGSPAKYVSTRMYSCGDLLADRCVTPTTPITQFASTGQAAVVAAADPFRTTSSHLSGSKCDTRPGCRTADTVAGLNINLNDFGGATARLINVCSYPSQQPNSSPSECVVAANNGFLTIVKEADPNQGSFQFTSPQAAQDGKTSWTVNLPDSNQVQFISYKPGVGYDLSELIPAGWSLESASCVIQTNPVTNTGTFDKATDPDTIADFEIKSGLETICTFRNTNAELNKGTLKVRKVVNNNYGGNKTATDFSFSVDGGAAVQFEADGENVVKVDPETPHNVTELAAAGYTPSYNGCTNVVIPKQGTATCEITNDQQGAHLTLVKAVTNDNGGGAVPTAWTLTASGPTSLSGATGSLAVTNAPVSAGSYTLGEDDGGPSGYTPSLYSCVKNGGSPVSSNSLTLANGDNATCTITNDDQPATLIVIKHVNNDNGRTKTASEFTMQVSGSNVLPSASFAGSESGTTVTLDAGDYSVDEAATQGYVKSIGENCSGKIKNGETVTCTITNDDERSVPGLTTAMSWVLHDSATLTGLVTGAPDAAQATILFKLYGPTDATCSGTPINGGGAGEVRPVSGATAATALGHGVTQPGTYRWIAVYSGDQYNTPKSTTCGDEVHTITVGGTMP